MTPALVRSLASAVAGALLAVAFPPFGWWPAAIGGVALLAVVVGGRRVRAALGYGLITGLVLFGVVVKWIAVVGTDAWAALVVFTALPVAATAAAMALVMRRRGWPWWIGVVWVAQEAFRDRIPLGGWPWGRLAYSQADAPWLPVASLGGAALLTFAVAACGGWLAWAWIQRSRAIPAVAAAGSVAAVPLLASLVPLSVSGETDGGPGSQVVAVVQGDVPRTGLGFAAAGERREVLDNHVAQTFALAEAVAAGREPQPAAVIWPENASDLDPFTAPDARAAIDAAAKAIQAPILVGAVITNQEDPQTVLNVGIVWDPQTGPGQIYVKQHPVPFGEYVPLRSVLTRFIGRFDLVPRDFAAGQQPGVLEVGPVLLGDIICFEVAYDDLVRDTVLAGARMLAVQTNNATYTGAGQSEQQLAMARIRSVEHSRTVAVAATNGISAIFLPDGSVTGQLPESTAGWLTADVPLRDSTTWADRLGYWPEVVALLLAVVMCATGLRTPPSVCCARSGGRKTPEADLEGLQHG